VARSPPANRSPPDGRADVGTAVPGTLLERFSESTKAGCFAKGTVRYVDATDLVSLELMGSHPVALTNAIDALARRWADTAEVDVEFLAVPDFMRPSSAAAPLSHPTAVGCVPVGATRKVSPSSP
jgi:hypothetical protein